MCDISCGLIYFNKCCKKKYSYALVTVASAVAGGGYIAYNIVACHIVYATATEQRKRRR